MNKVKEKILYKELSYKLQGLFYAIRNDLGSGHKESIYQKALEKELRAADIAFEKEPAIKIYSAKKEYLGLYRPDFVVENKIIIELKSAQFVTKQEGARMYDYLRNSKYELAYLVNFASPKLYIKRFLFTNDHKPRIATNIKRISTNIRRNSSQICCYSWIILFVAISFLFVGIRGIQAAELNLTSQTQEIGINQQFQVDLFLDTENEEINAVEGKIIFPENLIELKEIRDGNSIINFWIDKPLIDANINTNKREIRFSGITPGGYLGEKGLILSMVFTAKKEGQAIVQIIGGKTLLNDGKGTAANLTANPLSLAVISESISVPSRITALPDNEPPEDFKPEIASDPSIFDGKYFLVFATQDKGSGVASYAIHESTRKQTRINTKDWVEAESPYLLKDQNLRSWIYVKAVDKAGNERIAVVAPKYPMRWYERWEIWFIIIVLAALIFYVIKKVLWRKVLIH